MTPALASSGYAGAAPAVSAEEFWGLRFLGVIGLTILASPVVGFQMVVTVLTAVGVVATLAGIFRPTVGLYGIGILCVLDSVTRVLLMTGGLFRYNTFNYILLLAMLLAFPTVQKMTDSQTRLLIGLVSLMLLGLAISPDVPAGAFGLLNVVAEFGLLLYFIRARQSGHSLYWLAIVNGTLAPLACFVFFSQMSSIRFINPNAWAYMPVTGLFSICLGFNAAPHSWQRMGLLALSLANCACVFLSASRGSMLVAIICLIYLLLQTRSFGQRFFYIALGAVIIVGGSALFTEMRDYALSRINKLFDERYSVGGRTSGRSELVAAGVQMFQQNPLGRGTGAFAAELADIQGYSKQSHSGWIKTMVENGIIGAILLGCFIVSFAITGWDKRHRRGAAALGLLVTAALGCAFFSTEFNAKGLWFLAAGATAILNYPGPLSAPLGFQPARRFRSRL